MPSLPDRSGGPAFTTQLTLCCAMTFTGYLAVSMRLPIVPLHATALGASASQIGMINAAFYLAAGCLSLPAGILSDRLGRRRLALAGTLLMAVGLGLLAPSRSYIHLAGVYLILGIGIAAFGPTMMSWVAEIAPATHLGRAYGWYTTALFCGMGLGPAAGGTLAKDLGFTSVYLIGGVLMAVNLLLVGRLVPGAPARNRPGTQRRDSRQWRSVLSNRALIGCWAGTLGTCIVSGTFFTFLPLQAAAQGLDVSRIGVIFLVQSAANALARIPLGAASDRLGRRPLQALIGILLITASISAFAAARQFDGFMAAALASLRSIPTPRPPTGRYRDLAHHHAGGR